MGNKLLYKGCTTLTLIIFKLFNINSLYIINELFNDLLFL